MMKKYKIQALAICLILLTILFAPNISFADDENETENNIANKYKYRKVTIKFEKICRI